MLRVVSHVVIVRDGSLQSTILDSDLHGICARILFVSASAAAAKWLDRRRCYHAQVDARRLWLLN